MQTSTVDDGIGWACDFPVSVADGWRVAYGPGCESIGRSRNTVLGDCDDFGWVQRPASCTDLGNYACVAGASPGRTQLLWM